MGEFEIVAEGQRLIDGDVSVGLEVHETVGVTLDKRSTDEFGQDVERDGDTGDCLDQTTGDHDKNGHNDTEDEDDGGSVGGVDPDTDHTDDHGDEKDDGVLPLVDLGVVLLHQSVVDILVQVVLFVIVALHPEDLLDTLPKSAESGHKVVSVEEGDVRQG